MGQENSPPGAPEIATSSITSYNGNSIAIILGTTSSSTISSVGKSSGTSSRISRMVGTAGSLSSAGGLVARLGSGGSSCNAIALFNSPVDAQSSASDTSGISTDSGDSSTETTTTASGQESLAGARLSSLPT